MAKCETPGLKLRMLRVAPRDTRMAVLDVSFSELAPEKSMLAWFRIWQQAMVSVTPFRTMPVSFGPVNVMVCVSGRVSFAWRFTMARSRPPTTRGPSKAFCPAGSSMSKTPLLSVNVPVNGLAVSPRRMLCATCGTPPERHSNGPDPLIRPERIVSFPPPVSTKNAWSPMSTFADNCPVRQPKVVGPVRANAAVPRCKS